MNQNRLHEGRVSVFGKLLSLFFRLSFFCERYATFDFWLFFVWILRVPAFILLVILFRFHLETDVFIRIKTLL